MLYPPYIEKAVGLLEAAGFEAFVVGGALRDCLLGRPAHDWDVATSALPEETLSVFSDFCVITAGKKHGTVAPIIDGQPVEITTYRIDGDYHDARHPDKVSFTRTLRDDLARRDFTVNALAYNHSAGLCDYFGGQEDLRAGILRAVGEPACRFREDALRILRGFRFAAVLGFTIESATLDAMIACREGLSMISAERKAVELAGLLAGKEAPRALSLMKSGGILPYVAPGLEAPDDVYEAMGRLSPVFELRAAFLLCRQRKEIVTSFGESLRLSGASRRHIQVLWEHRGETFEGPDADVRRLMAASGAFFPEIIEMGKAFGFSTARWERAAADALARGDCLSLAELAVTGRDLLALGIRGHAVGETLSALFEHVLEHPEDNKKEILLRRI